ncbi:hypothetical protein [Sphingopyxis solisilvae]|uniref:hypothetical protein n=1 Tax=Sphingopyxis solisilvae TaxID=1886788 RepID=UPI001892BF82|nr:hypothetical protein [Sphingopyxis solisilvae]
MTALHWPWSFLDIAPTQDRKLIREAYSRRLKALDHDAETEAYMALRDARDAALSGHFLCAPATGDEDDFGLGELSSDEEADAEETRQFTSEAEEKPVFTVEYNDEDDRRFQRVVDLFLQDGALTSEEAEELERHIDALFDDDRMADLGHYARVESWLAQLLADRFPRGAEFFPKAAEYFNWSERAHELGIHPAIPWLVNADEGRRVLSAIATPGHVYHREWVELSRGKAKGPLWTRGIDNPRMANLIATVRRDYPWLEQEHWQPELVARWEKKVEGGSVKGPGLWTWVALAIFALSGIGRLVDTDSSRIDHNPAALAALHTAKADAHIASFIETEFPDAQADGRSVETLRSKSPKTFAALHKVASDFDTLDEARNRIMMREITELYYLIIDKLPYEDQVMDAKLRATTIQKMKSHPRGCAEFIRNPRTYLRQGNSAGLLSPEYRYQIFSTVHDHYDDREWALVPKRAEIPGELVGKLVRRSGVPEERLGAVLRSRESPDEDVCRVIGSFYELLTEIPAKEADKILPAIL